MANLNNLKLTLTSDRKLIAIECDDFRIKLNGAGNSDYISVLKPLGIVLEFKNDEPKAGPDLVAAEKLTLEKVLS